jgi:hypothetical protein
VPTCIIDRMRLHVHALIAIALLAAGDAGAQVRGVYPTGMNALNAGVAPSPGWAYSNLFIVNSRDRRAGPDGETLATGVQSVLLDLNTFAWGSEEAMPTGARFGATATIILSKNSLESDVEGSLGGGSGLGDLFIQPVILGWTNGQCDWRAAYGIVAPTGRFEAGADDNVGSGYWTHALSSGATFHLSENRSNSLSAFAMYELHEKQETTDIRPGDTLSLDASWMHAVAGRPDRPLQYGIVGYAQWQTSDKRGPGVTAEEARDRYRVAALGFAAGLSWPQRRFSLAFKLFHEFDARSTFEGYSAQLSASFAF